MKKDQTTDLSAMIEGFNILEGATQQCVKISERNIGMTHTGRQRRALFVFSKLIVHNMSALNIAQKFLDKPTDEALLDHWSMAVLARASIDAALMTMYISEPSLSLNQWDLRRQLLFLHDNNNRSRFLKPLTKQGIYQAPDNSHVTKQLHDRIKELGPLLLYGEEKIAEYLKGWHLFVEGVRGAVREAKWDVDHFEFNQSYLSAYVHSHPVSFMRADEHGVAFGGASEFQAAFCHYLMTMLSEYTKSAADRMDAFSVPEKGDPNGHLE